MLINASENVLGSGQVQVALLVTVELAVIHLVPGRRTVVREVKVAEKHWMIYHQDRHQKNIISS